MYKQSVSYSVQMTLIPITIGVGIATVYDLSINMIGLGKYFIHNYIIIIIIVCMCYIFIYMDIFMFVVFAVLAVIATSMAQIFTNTYQKSLNCDALQLLNHTSPLITLGMLIMCPMFDNVQALMEFEYTAPCVSRIALSCVFALGVNVSNYVVLGKTSPLTYQVHMYIYILFLTLSFIYLFMVISK